MSFFKKRALSHKNGTRQVLLARHLLLACAISIVATSIGTAAVASDEYPAGSPTVKTLGVLRGADFGDNGSGGSTRATTAASSDHERAVQLARQGRYDEALPILQSLHNSQPGNVSVTRDYLAVLGWAGGHDALVVSLYRTLGGDQPDYVIEAAAKSYRNMRQPNDSLALYQNGLARSPANVSFAVGVIRSLADSGQTDAALAAARDNISRYGERPEVLVATAETADQAGRVVETVYYYKALLSVSPQNNQAWRGLIRMAVIGGDFDNAMALASQHPEAITPAEYRQIVGDKNAALVRNGMDEKKTRSERNASTDAALANYQATIPQWSMEGAAAQRDVLRLHADKILALNSRKMPREVIREYESMGDAGALLPTYAMSAVANSYLTLREPEKARDLYLNILKTDPKNYEVRRQLFYAYTECDDYDDAFRVADALAQENSSSPNGRSAGLLAGSGRLFSGQVSEADRIITPIATANLQSPSSREALGNLYAAHGWLAKASEQYAAGAALSNGDIGNEVGIASTNLRLRNYQTATAETNALMARDPDNQSVQRLNRDINIQNDYELRVKVANAFPPDTTTNVSGGAAYGIDSVLYSPPIGYNWRIFAGEYFTHQIEPNEEGRIDFSRSAMGAEYRNGPLTADASPTFNHYNGNDRVGAAGDASFDINDSWTVAGSGEMFSRDTPLRAMNAGVTADSVNAHAVWHPDEEREVRFGGSVMPFSDGNLRIGNYLSYTQRVYTSPHIRINGLADAGGSYNSADNNRLYYNPASDVIGLIGGQLTQYLYQRYSLLYQHSLKITPGFYSEQGYGYSPVVRASYEQRVFFNDVLNAGLGVNFSRQSYDGAPENDVGLSLDVTERF